MTPYYQDNAVTIYLGDAREVLPMLLPLDVDVTLTDPPYGMNYVSNWYKAGNPHGEITGDDVYPLEIVKELLTISKIATMAFCRWPTLALFTFKPKSVLVWIKNNWTAGDLQHEYGRQWEAVAFWPGPDHRFTTRPADVVFVDRVPCERMIHPTEKPLSLITRLLSHHEGKTILDPFMGSGTTLRAAKDMGLKAIGIEIEERYAEIAAKRMAQEVLAL